MTSSAEPTTYYIKELNPEIIAPSTKQMQEGSFGGSKIVVIGKPGCVAPGTKILMYNGEIKKVENIKVGEQIMGDDSNPRNVLELCHNTDEMFQINPRHGESYTVNKQHILVLINNEKTIEITVDEFMKQTEEFKKQYKVFRKAVQFKQQKLEIEPYMFGLLIGNGLNKKNLNLSIKKYIDDYLKINQKVVEKGKYNINGKEESFYRAKIKTIEKYNLFNNIPLEYKANSRENRLQLLAGILDSFNQHKNTYNFINKNEQLFEDVLFLSRSLGFSVTKHKNIEDYYCCSLYGNVSEIPSKIHNICNNQNILESDFEIEAKGHGEYYGFVLDGNHRFLLDTCDVLHNTGKSSLIASLLYAKKHIFPVALAFSGSEDSNGFYNKLLPGSFVFNEYNEDQIKSFVRRQKIAKAHLPNPWAVILLDDCTDDPKIFNTPLQHGMFKRGRHFSMLYIISLQYALDIKPVIRINIDGTFILREPNLKIRRVLYENYAGCVPDFNLFCELMDKLTDEWSALYVHNQSSSTNWEDNIYWYKADLIDPNWKFGSKDYHEFHEQRYNPDYVDPFL